MENIDNLDKLVLGAIYSYKELCELLEEKEEAGNSRVAQFTRWNSYITFEKVGRKLKVLSVFQSRTLAPTNFKAGGVHLTNSGYLLMEYFLQNKDLVAIPSEKFPNIYHVTLFPREVAEICGFLPESYKLIKQGLLAGSVDIPTSSLIQTLFGQIVNGTVSDMIKTTLNSLSKKKVFNLANIYLGRLRDKSLRELSFDEVTKLSEIKLTYWKTTYPDKSLQAMKFEYEDYQNIESILEQEFGVTKVYPAYKLGFSSEVLTKFLLEQEESMAKLANNNVVKTRVKTKVEKEKAIVDTLNLEWKENLANGKVNNDESYVNAMYKRNQIFHKDALEEFNRLIDKYLSLEDRVVV